MTAELFNGSWQQALGRYRSSCAYRGQPFAAESLVPSIARMGERFWEVEAPMLRAFRQYARREVSGCDSEWDWLAVAQHHGLPTRLLDWTYSPLVAMHFATVGCKDEDGLIWCVDYRASNRYLPARLKRVLASEGADVFTAETLARVAPTLTGLGRLSRKEFVTFLEPPSLDTRMVNQFALFSLLSDPRTRLDQWLEQHPAGVRRIVVPAEIKPRVRDMLDQANINERVLFPGLDGLSLYLRRYYAPTPLLAELHERGSRHVAPRLSAARRVRRRAR